MIQQHVAADMFQETQLHFQIVVLERQIFAWIGVAPAKLSTLCLATPTRLVSAAACLRRGELCWVQPACNPAGCPAPGLTPISEKHLLPPCRTLFPQPPRCCPALPTTTSPACLSG